MSGAARGFGLWEQAARIATARCGECAENAAKAAAQAQAKADAKAKAQAALACDAKAKAKAKAETKAAAAAKAEARANAKAKADDDLAAIAGCLAKNKADVATIQALGAARVYADTAHAGTTHRTAAAGGPMVTCVTSGCANPCDPTGKCPAWCVQKRYNIPITHCIICSTNRRYYFASSPPPLVPRPDGVPRGVMPRVWTPRGAPRPRRKLMPEGQAEAPSISCSPPWPKPRRAPPGIPHSARSLPYPDQTPLSAQFRQMAGHPFPPGTDSISPSGTPPFLPGTDPISPSGRPPFRRGIDPSRHPTTKVGPPGGM